MRGTARGWEGAAGAGRRATVGALRVGRRRRAGQEREVFAQARGEGESRARAVLPGLQIAFVEEVGEQKRRAQRQQQRFDRRRLVHEAVIHVPERGQLVEPAVLQIPAIMSPLLNLGGPHGGRQQIGDPNPLARLHHLPPNPSYPPPPHRLFFGAHTTRIRRCSVENDSSPGRSQRRVVRRPASITCGGWSARRRSASWYSSRASCFITITTCLPAASTVSMNGASRYSASAVITSINRPARPRIRVTNRRAATTSPSPGRTRSRSTIAGGVTPTHCATTTRW